MNNQTAREMTPTECIAKARKHIEEADIKIAAAERLVILAEKRAEAEKVKYPPVTGRPFCKSVNEPEEGQQFWFRGMGGGCHQSRYVERLHEDAMRRGELYPTKADCLYGEKKREIEARYRGMGRPYVKNAKNWNACFDRITRKVELYVSGCTDYGHVYFETKETCQSAIDTINREYGDGAFEEFILGVR